MKLNYDNILKEIKKVSKKYIKKDRPVGLAISNFDSRVGAYWISGGNYIVLNGNLLSALDELGVPDTEKEKLVKIILLHEYIHSLGYEDEMATRIITQNITAQEYGKNSLEYRLSSEGPWEVYPEISQYRGKFDSTVKIINNFDTDSTDYIT